MASMCSSTAWMPPGPMRPRMCRRVPRSAAWAQAAVSAGFVSKDPSSIASEMRGRSCSTRKPAPRLRWPTSELPIWPAGSPTAVPAASSRECGQCARSPCQVGMSAASNAFRFGSSLIPKPSRTHRTTGFGGRAALVDTRRSAVQLSCASDDVCEPLRVEGGAADEGAVNVRLGEELTSIVGCHAAAVQDWDPIRVRWVELAKKGPDLRRGSLCVLPGGSVPRPDGPDRLISDGQAGPRDPSEVCEAVGQLAVDDRLRFSRGTLFELLPDREDRSQTVGDGTGNLASHRLIGFAEVLAALRV